MIKKNNNYKKIGVAIIFYMHRILVLELIHFVFIIFFIDSQLVVIGNNKYQTN